VSTVICVLCAAAGERAVASLLAAVLTEMYLCASCSCQDVSTRNIEERNGPGQLGRSLPGVHRCRRWGGAWD
jgi:hypothetical protein